MLRGNAHLRGPARPLRITKIEKKDPPWMFAPPLLSPQADRWR
jgi:hypothetical protein